MNEIEIPPPTQLAVDQIYRLLETEKVGNGNHIVYVPSVDSTNSLAMKLARDGSEEGVVVLADRQTAGRGRQGRQWAAMEGWNVLSSIVLRPLFPPYQLVMIASLAVVDAITSVCGITATIKWPNDVLIGDRKVAGILIETSKDLAGQLVAIVGIGVNVNGRINQYVPRQTELQTVAGLVTTAITLAEASGHVVSREAFIASLLYQIETRYLAVQQEAQQTTRYHAGPISRLIREQWRHRLSTLGRTIEVRQGSQLLSGVAEDVNDQGELLLRHHSGECTIITWGDVALIG